MTRAERMAAMVAALRQKDAELNEAIAAVATEATTLHAQAEQLEQRVERTTAVQKRRDAIARRRWVMPED